MANFAQVCIGIKDLAQSHAGNIDTALKSVGYDIPFKTFLDYYTDNISNLQYPIFMVQMISEEDQWFSLPSNVQTCFEARIVCALTYNDERTAKLACGVLAGVIKAIFNQAQFPITLPDGSVIYFGSGPNGQRSVPPISSIRYGQIPRKNSKMPFTFGFTATYKAEWVGSSLQPPPPGF